MTKGILGVIACPMLEDELIYSLGKDPEEKHVYVTETPHNGPLKRKMAANGIPFTVVDEYDFMNCCIDFDRDAYNVVIRMKDLGLHAEPKKLMEDLQNDLIMIQGRVDAVAMYYGMCGNYGWDLTRWAEEHVDFPVTVFRDCQGRVCDDCVGVAVGGLDGYKRLLKDFTGMLFLTPAVATNWEEFLGASDMMQGVDSIMGPGNKHEQMKWMFHIAGYTHAVQIDTGLEDRAEFDAKSREVSEEMELQLIEAPPGYADLGPADKIYAESKENLDRANAS